MCINRDYYPEEYKEALDPEYSMKFAIGLILKGEEYKFTLCSCIQTAKMLGVPIPRGTDASEIMPDGTPKKGGLLLLKYGKIYHVAVIQEINIEGNYYLVKEGNYQKCKLTVRKIPRDSLSIRGFWLPPKGG